MLSHSRIIGFAPTTDAAKAKDFYVANLGWNSSVMTSMRSS